MNDPNQKGSVGELAVAKHLVRLGYHVYNSLTKHSKTDLVVLTSDYKRCIKVQIKTTSSKDDKVVVETKKKCLNPKYNFNYLPEHADVFAVYIENIDLVFFVPQVEFLANKKSITYRLKTGTFSGSCQHTIKYVEDRLILP